MQAAAPSPSAPRQPAPSSSTAAAAPSIGASVSCLDCLNSLFHCWGAAHQFDRLYKDGAFDGCARPQAELALCLRLKLSAGDAAGSLAAARTLLRDSEPASPTEGIVWQPRPRPRTLPHA